MSQKADLILENGKILTMEESYPLVESLAIEGSQIIWVGKRGACPLKGSQTKIIDLKGATVLPGFIESHAHLVPLGLTKTTYLDLSGLKAKSEILQEVKKQVDLSPIGTWIIGFGWDEDLWTGKNLPTARDLDAVAPSHPVFLRRIDSHSVWVNSYVLTKAQIDKDTPDPTGGKIHRTKEGSPTGILVDKAVMNIYSLMPQPSIAETVNHTHIALEECLKNGITMVHNAATTKVEMDAFKKLSQTHLLPIKIYAMAVVPADEGHAYLKKGPEIVSPHLETRCLKFFMDGALGSRGAALFEPYADDPTNEGLLLWEEKELLPLLQKAKSQGLQVAFHAIGDRAVHLVLNAYEKIGVKNLRWRIEHCQLIAPSDVPRFEKLGVIAAVQPLHMAKDLPWLLQRLGKKRAEERAFIWNSLKRSGAQITGGSDAPVVEINPLWGLYTAITGKNPKNPKAPAWHTEECLTREETLKIYTVNGAFASFKESSLGSIKVGKIADLTVLPLSPLTCPPEALIDMEVLYTIVNGKILYQSPSL